MNSFNLSGAQTEANRYYLLINTISLAAGLIFAPCELIQSQVSLRCPVGLKSSGGTEAVI